MSQQRPRDLLEFLRRASADESDRGVDAPQKSNPPVRERIASVPEVPPKVAPTKAPRTGGPTQPQEPPEEPSKATPHVTVSQGDAPMVVLRRSQVVVAGVAAGLLIVLAYMLGSTWGDENAADQKVYGPVGVWTIVVIEYNDNPHGQISAKAIKAGLAKRDWDEVMIEQLDRDRKLWVTIGSWVSNPKTNRRAMSLLSAVQKLRVQGSDKLEFAEAYFARIER
jgi:hypothetical protein